MVHNCKLRLRLCALREACTAPKLTLAASLVVWFALSAIAAPFVDEGAHRLLDAAPKPPPHLSGKFLEAVRGLLAGAAHLVTQHVAHQRISQSPMETRGVVATRDGPEELTLYITCQSRCGLPRTRSPRKAEAGGTLQTTNQADSLRVYEGAMRLSFVERLTRPIQVLLGNTQPGGN